MKPFSKLVLLKGSERVLPKAKKLAKIDKNELIDISIKLRAKKALPNLLDPAVYKNFKPLTQQKLSKEYGSSESDLKTVHAFAHHMGLSILKNEPGKKTMQLRGTIKQMEAAFKVNLSNYKSEEGNTFRGRKGSIKIPQELDGIVEAVFGLDNRAIAKTKFKIAPKSKTKKGRKTVASHAYYPTDISKIYNFPQNATGKKQTIALIGSVSV